MKNTAILSLGVLMLMLGGCTGSFSKVRGAINDAPEWYQGQRAAISDEGYPKLSNVPALRTDVSAGTELLASRDELKDALAMLDNHARAALPDRETSDMYAEIAALNRELDALNTPTDFLTPQDVAAIHAQFDIGRAKLKF